MGIRLLKFDKHQYDNVYGLTDVLPLDLFYSVLDEFNSHYNHWVFDKKDKHLESEMVENLLENRLPYFGRLTKPNITTLGDNLMFLKVATRLRLEAQRILKRKLELKRVNTNIQFHGQDSSFHTDGGPERWTMLVFIHFTWDSEWGGDFICQIDDSYVGIPYIPNNGVLFRADLEHRGSAPNLLCPTERKTLALTYEEY